MTLSQRLPHVVHALLDVLLNGLRQSLRIPHPHCCQRLAVQYAATREAVEHFASQSADDLSPEDAAKVQRKLDRCEELLVEAAAEAGLDVPELRQ